MEYGVWAYTDNLINIYGWPNSPTTGTPPAGRLAAQLANNNHSYVNMFDGTAHTYSMLVTPTKIVVYWDHVEKVRFPVLGRDMILPWSHSFSLTMHRDPGTATAPYTATVTNFVRWTCSPAPRCFDQINP